MQFQWSAYRYSMIFPKCLKMELASFWTRHRGKAVHRLYLTGTRFLWLLLPFSNLRIICCVLLSSIYNVIFVCMYIYNYIYICVMLYAVATVQRLDRVDIRFCLSWHVHTSQGSSSKNQNQHLRHLGRYRSGRCQGTLGVLGSICWSTVRCAHISFSIGECLDNMLIIWYDNYDMCCFFLWFSDPNFKLDCLLAAPGKQYQIWYPAAIQPSTCFLDQKFANLCPLKAYCAKVRGKCPETVLRGRSLRCWLL